MSELSKLIIQGRSQGYLLYSDVKTLLPEDASDPEQIASIVQMFKNMGIEVHKTAPGNTQK